MMGLLPLLSILVFLQDVSAATLVKRSSGSSGRTEAEAVKFKQWKNELKNNPTELLKLEGVRDMLINKFSQRELDLSQLSEQIERSVDSIIVVSEEITKKDTLLLTDSLTKAIDVKKRVDQIRGRLSTLAKRTVKQCDRIIKKVEDVRGGEKTIQEKFRSIVRTMNSLLKDSKRALDSAQIDVEKASNEMSAIAGNVMFFQGLLKRAVVSSRESSRETTKKDTQDIFKTTFGFLKDIKGDHSTWSASCNRCSTRDLDEHGKAACDKRKTECARRKSVSGTDFALNQLLKKLPAAFQIGYSIYEAATKEDTVQKITEALEKVTTVLTKINEESENLERERTLIRDWSDAVESIRDTYGNDEDFLNDLPNVFDDGDYEEIIVDFTGLRDVAQEYADHVDDICPACSAT